MINKQKWTLKSSRAKLQVIALLLLPSIPVQAAISYADVGQLIWEDNFNTLNSEYWTVDEGDGCDIGLCGWGNAELQSYSSNNVSIASIEDGNNALLLQAKSESIDGSNFTSGKINSENKITVQYGMIEMRINVPDLDQGLWPAAWMLGTSTLSWPAKGEIDMMEMGHSLASRQSWLSYNSDASDDNDDAPDMNNYTGSNMIFYSDDACSDGNATCAASLSWQVDNAYVSDTPISERFVTYRTYWTESEMRFTVVDNGVEHDVFESPFTLGENLSAFQAPYYLLFNLAVGGNFTDAATASEVTAPVPASMYIDYIRVYELDSQGSVTIGDQTTAETGVFGVFTDQTEATNQLEAGLTSEIFLWDSSSSEGSESPYEGDSVISWNVNTANVWFGSGVQSYQALNMSNYEETGELSFNIKIPADIDFRIGITDTYSNEHWLTFPANVTTYGLQRDGEWGQVTIPISDLKGESIALQSIQYPFAISSDASNLPSHTFNYAIDNILWRGADESTVNSDSDQDGVYDANDLCSDTPVDSVVDAVGCAVATDSVEINSVEVTQIDADTWTDVTFEHAFTNIPTVTAGAFTFNGSHPAALRIRNITPSGFEVQVDEWDYLDGAHSTETISYIAVEAGVQDWGGLHVVANKINDMNTAWQSITFDSAFTEAPMVIAQQVSNNGSEATTTRVRNITEKGFDLRLQEEESNNATHTNETVNYLAIATGSGEINERTIIVEQATEKISSTWASVDFTGAIPEALFIADMQSNNGGNVATLRYRDLTESSVALKVQEEQSKDNETWHQGETVSWMLVGAASNDDSGGDDDPIVVPIDNDNDGVDDSIDACLDSSPDATVDGSGCEATPSLISANGSGAIVSTASTEMQAATLAFDGNIRTRWESTHGIDPSILTLDLGKSFYLTQAILYWEAANAQNYTLEASTDNENWTTVASYTEGSFGGRTDTLSLAGGDYRYIRMNGTSRSDGNFWGYSIFEMEVYGIDPTLINIPSDGSGDDGSGDDGSGDDGSGDDGSGDGGSGDDGSGDDGSGDDGSGDDGSGDDGSGDDGSGDDGSGDDGSGDDGSGDDASGDDGSGDDGSGDDSSGDDTDFWGDTDSYPEASNVLTYVFLNKTDGEFDDSEVFWSFGDNTHSIADMPTYDMEANSSGRVYFYVGEENGQYWDFMEHTITENNWYGNTTRVDGYRLPIAMRLICGDGTDTQLGEIQEVFEMDRDAFFETYKDSVPDEFDHCADNGYPYTIIAPGKGDGGFAEGQQYEDYFDDYLAELGITDSTTNQVFSCSGATFGTNAGLAGAVNRHVAHLDESEWENPDNFYLESPANYYAKFFHDWSYDNKAYGFAYDDAAGQAAYTACSDPQYLIIGIGY